MQSTISDHYIQEILFHDFYKLATTPFHIISRHYNISIVALLKFVLTKKTSRIGKIKNIIIEVSEFLNNLNLNLNLACPLKTFKFSSKYKVNNWVIKGIKGIVLSSQILKFYSPLNKFSNESK